MSQPIILVDAMNLAFRMHYSHRNLSSDGRPTGMTFGFLKTVHDLREHVSDRIVFCWDHGIPQPGAEKPRNWRDDVVKDYKASRKHDDAEYAKIAEQLPDLSKLIRALGYSNVAVMGLEADDVIGILSRQIEGEVLIFSTDRDFYQLLDEARVHVLVPKKTGGKFKRVFQSDVEREYGFPVCRWPEYLALGGDKSDGIKPMRGMGPKTAAGLVKSGIDLARPLSLQPDAFKSKYAAAWLDIQACYCAARVPTRWDDPRIQSALTMRAAIATKGLNGCQYWKDAAAKAAALKFFVEHCADRDMTSLLALRRELFHEKGEQKCEIDRFPARRPERIRRLFSTETRP